MLAELDAQCADVGAEAADVARLAALDLCAGPVAFGGVRALGELIGWIGREAPAVALMACRDISELPPLSVRRAPQAASTN
jgi:hypothetical protein